MDAYREMTHSNQAREVDALFTGIDVYNEDPSCFEGWLDVIFQKTCMILHGPRLQKKRTLDHQATFQIDYRRATLQKTI